MATAEDQKTVLRQRLTDLETKVLRAQMNPHFIFNSLNSIQHYVFGKDIQGANRFITEFARLIRMTMEMMGESMDETMHVESEGDFAEELADYADPLRDTRGFKAMTSGIPFMDSTATAELEKLMRAAPRGLALRQVDRVTGVTEGDMAPPTTTTTLSNIKRTTFPPSVFDIPEGYTESVMPMMGGPEVN